MFLLILTISYFTRDKQIAVQPAARMGPRAPRMEREYGFAIPQGYSFHPGHTWALKEGPETVRVGLDGFATNLLGKIDHIDVIGQNRWVRQGQKLMSVRSGELTLDLLSPVEGVITAVNGDALTDPSQVTRDPYHDGWIATIKSPELDINQKNLVQGGMVAPWLQNNVTRLNAALGQLSPALAQDGGLPMAGLLSRVAPELRKRLVQEFFLN
jgi:glycine cleavage system H lipoate-binding protein